MSLRRVLQFRQSANIWGPDRCILGVSTELRKFGFESEIAILYRRVAGLPPEHPILPEARRLGIPVTQLDGHWKASATTIAWLRRRLRRQEIHVVHSHEYKTDIVAATASAGLKTNALVATVRHTEPGLQFGLFQELDSLFLHRFQRLVLPSQGALVELRRWPLLRQRTRVVHHSFQPAPSRPPSPLPPGTSPVISMLARLTAVKGHALFLQAASQLSRIRPDVQFWLAGEGELRPDLEALATSLGIAHAVQFLGYREDPEAVIAASDLVVSASHYEAFGRTILEAQHLGRPVVATAVGGVPELIRDGETGLLAPPANPSALADAMRRLLEDPILAQRLGAAGQKSAGERFTVHAEASALAQVYAEALELRGLRG